MISDPLICVMQFTGHVKLPSAGLWSFSLTSDDGSLLYIDGALLINNDGIYDSSVDLCTYIFAF